MAHEISEVMIDGRRIAEAMYANRPAWHGLGQIFGDGSQQAPDSQTAIKMAHLEWLVAKEPLSLAQDGRAVAGYFGLVRQDTRETLSVVGNEYHPLQNREAFEFLDSLQADNVMRYESAFALKGGRQICLLARMPSVDHVTAEDHILRYMLFTMSHGGGAIIGCPTAVRVVCANTQRLALQIGEQTGKVLTIRHSGNLQNKLRIARNYLAQCDAAFTGYCAEAQQLLKGYTPEQAWDYIEQLFPAPLPTAGDRAKTNWQAQVAQVRAAFQSDAQRLATVKGTWWAMFNAVTEVVDHGRATRQSRDYVARRENRFLSVTSGEGANFKSHALSLALTMAA